MKKNDPSVIKLIQAYAEAEEQIKRAVVSRRNTVVEYKKNIGFVVSAAMARLDKLFESFSGNAVPESFRSGQQTAQNHAPTNYEKYSERQAGQILKQAGLRYSSAEQSKNTYIELHSATKSAGEGFLRRVNQEIRALEKEGKNTVYAVMQGIRKEIEQQGILNVEYRGGKKVPVAAYAAMAARSARMESSNIGAFGRALENGTDYVRCSEMYPTCEICARYQGKIYCISGKDKRFPALFQTALQHGYALIHPNCRHEFIPVWLETMGEEELRLAIENSKISAGDPRSVQERNAYARQQDRLRQINREQLYFTRAKQRLGKAMPYENIAAFRRSYRAPEETFAHKRSHNLIRDYQEYSAMETVLIESNNFPKSLAKFQELKYNKKQEYELLNRENITISKIKAKNWSPIFIQKALETYYNFREKNIELTDHSVARLLQRGFDKDKIIDICKNYPFNFIQEDGKKIKFYSGITVIYAPDSDELVSIVSRSVPKGEWKNV